MEGFVDFNTSYLFIGLFTSFREKNAPLDICSTSKSLKNSTCELFQASMFSRPKSPTKTFGPAMYTVPAAWEKNLQNGESAKNQLDGPWKTLEKNPWKIPGKLAGNPQLLPAQETQTWHCRFPHWRFPSRFPSPLQHWSPRFPRLPGRPTLRAKKTTKIDLNLVGKN